MGVGGQGSEIGHAVAAGAGREGVVEGQRGQHGEAPGAGAPDEEPLGVGVAPVHQIAGCGRAVGHVGHPPAAVQGPAVAAPVAGRAPVVDVHHRYAPRRPVQDGGLEPAAGRGGGAAVGQHQQRGQLVGRTDIAGVGGPVVEGVGPVGSARPGTGDIGGTDSGGGEGDGLGRRREPLAEPQRAGRPDHPPLPRSRLSGGGLFNGDGDHFGLVAPARRRVGHGHGPGVGRLRCHRVLRDGTSCRFSSHGSGVGWLRYHRHRGDGRINRSRGDLGGRRTSAGEDQLVASRAADRGHHPGRARRPALYSQHPGRAAGHVALGGDHPGQGPGGQIDLVEVPPFVVVAAHQQAVPPPAGLDQAPVSALPHHRYLRPQGSVTQFVHMQPGGVPGHMGVVPANPGQPVAGGRGPGGHHEVGPGPQHLRPLGSVGGHRHQLVDRLRVSRPRHVRVVGGHRHQFVGGLGAVALPHAYAPAPVGGHPPVGVAPGPGLGRRRGEHHLLGAGAV